MSIFSVSWQGVVLGKKMQKRYNKIKQKSDSYIRKNVPMLLC